MDISHNATEQSERPLTWIVSAGVVGAIALLGFMYFPAEKARALTAYNENCAKDRQQVCLKLGFRDGSPEQGNCMQELASFQTKHEKNLASRDVSF